MKLHRITRPNRTGRRIVGAVTALALASGLAMVSATAASASSSTDPAYIGLFGSQDPTFDGVYRQSLSIIVLDAAGANVPEPAVKWLKRQQCSNGSFTSFRANLTAKCGAKDSNATALAAIAFKRLGEGKLARTAVDWLIANQDRSGGWEYTAGWGADSNSTGLVIQALIALKIDPATVTTRRSGPQFLRRLQLDCDSADAATRGALDYQFESPLIANDFATSQATAAVAGSACRFGRAP